MLRIAVLVMCLIVPAATATLANGPRTSARWAPYQDITKLYGANVYLFDSAHVGYDPTESRYPYDSWDDSATFIYSYFRRDAGIDGWDGLSGWYFDQELPPPSPGSSVVVSKLYVWAEPSFAYDTLYIGYVDPGFAHPEQWVRTLRLVDVPDGITYTGPTEWSIPLYTTKVMGAFLPNAVLPAYRTDNPLTGYQFELDITHIPEPSCLLALLTALGGFGVTVTHRRGR